MSKRSHLTVTLIGIGVVLCAALLILWTVLSPLLTAKKALSEQLNTLRRAEEFDYLAVMDPRDVPGTLLPTDREVHLTDGTRIGALRERLCDALEGARYAGQESGESGNWEPRVRFSVRGETVDFYLREDALYLVRGNVRFVFTPAEAAVWAAVYEEMMGLLTPQEGAGA